MKIGDKVRFLNEVGGGVVSGFQDKQTVLVQDADGFDIPMLITDCVVVETDDYNIAKVHTITPSSPREAEPESDEPAPLERPYTYTTRATERPEGNVLNAYLAFVAAPDGGGDAEPRFETYLINDSNYTLAFTYLSAEGAGWRVRFSGTAEPNTKLMLEVVERSAVQQIERVSVQLLAYKTGRPFALKPALNVELRIDGTRFFKPGAFVATDFFEEQALLVPAVRDDDPVRSMFIHAGQLQQALMEKKAADDRPARPAPKTQLRNDGPIEVDLHASALLDSTDGLEPRDILDCQLRRFDEVMQAHLRHKGTRIVFIHGKGNGVLRQELLKALHQRYKSCTSQDASFREYGFGATMVTIR